MINHYDHDRMNESDVQIISPENDGFHYFFGYYDLPATDKNGENHLCHRVKFMDRMPTADDVCELGILTDRKFYPFAETTAWNFQQDAALASDKRKYRLLQRAQKRRFFDGCTQSLKRRKNIYRPRMCDDRAERKIRTFGQLFKNI